ncbi:hypothetical protein QWI44_12950 [Acinetobacter pittii]|uniref:DUF7940 domain-containing protein n=1 Tax=Acinetobacter calcoaceticus/baumannii complex TaxID=909768 RepID=UPI00046191A3|nr:MULTISPECIES: hypothetical protein [Acinetobacter calcoaceticus/baumannii complex]KCX14473.1 hypothetical protein J723_3229 [Acinetobacter sp. 1264765]KRI18434.1 hypothetical protein APC96_19920 [Acinetobacter pittii]MDP7901573.1 hypothetical protein [Acinetobacter pittii]
MSQWKRNFRRQVVKKQNAAVNQGKQVEPQTIQGVVVKLKKRWIVENWRSGWLWLSNWFFALIAYIQLYGVPPELIQLFPLATQKDVTATLAVLGFFTRFIDQNRAKPLPPVDEDN